MDTLWLKFPDEVLLGHVYTAETKKKLEDIFSNATPQSQWMKSLAILGIKSGSINNEPMIYWYMNVPYFNWTYYVSLISGGSVSLHKSESGGYVLRFNSGFRQIISLISIQWKIARFLAKANIVEDILIESIALGIALQAQIFRLGADSDKMPEWLAARDLTPQKHLNTINQIQAIQVRRTHISDVWKEHFNVSEQSEHNIEGLPDYFWDDDIPKENVKTFPTQNISEDGAWKGKSVCAGMVSGIAIVVKPKFKADDFLNIRKEYDAPLIFIFKNARPESVELFECADAVVFCNGGVLSHACTVAREMNIPCVTAIGSEFYESIKGRASLWLHVDAREGKVEMVTSN